MKFNKAFGTTLILILSLSWCANAQDSKLSDADSNEDGTISVEEFQTYAGTKLEGFEHLSAFAKAVDADGNGEITDGEFQNRFETLQMINERGNDLGEKSDDGGAMTNSKQSTEDGRGAKRAFEKIKSLISGGKWEDAAKHMTKKAQTDLIVEQVVSSIAMTKMEMPVPIPQIEDSVDEIDNVLIKHGLDKLDLDIKNMFSFKMSIDGDTESDADADEDTNRVIGGTKQADMSGKIMLAIDKGGKKWEVINDLWQAKKSSPLAMSVWNGKVDKNLADAKEKDVVLLRVEMAGSHSDEIGGVGIKVVAPPTIVRMKKTGKDWQYDGNDHERTQKAMSEFMEKQGGFGGGPPRKDF